MIEHPLKVKNNCCSFVEGYNLFCRYAVLFYRLFVYFSFSLVEMNELWQKRFIWNIARSLSHWKHQNTITRIYFLTRNSILSIRVAYYDFHKKLLPKLVKRYSQTTINPFVTARKLLPSIVIPWSFNKATSF